MTRHDSRDPWMPGPSGQIELPGYRDFVLIARSEGSEVYRAHQDGVDRPVAVKVLLLDDVEAIARFERELAITVQLGRQHPHIVNVIDTGTTSDGRPCIVMEHYDRGSLHDRLRTHGPLTWEEVLAAGTVVADALSFAHRHGVLHRDVKPQNILAMPTSYVVADFGIARRIDAARTASVEWFSFRHAAPQVLDGDPPAVTDDVWSLGSTMFTLLDGQAPFAAGNAAEDTALAYMKRVRTGRPRALGRRDVPPGMVAIIDRCMRHERADRFPDARALHAALSDLAAETRAWAPPSTTRLPGAVRPGSGTAPPPATARTHPTAPRPTTAPGPHAPMADATVNVRAGAVSPSELARVVASAVAAGGYGDDADATAGLYVEPRPDAPASPVPAHRLRRVLVGAAVALLVGSVLGVAGTWVVGRARGNAGQTTQPPARTGPPATVPGSGPATPDTPGSAPANINNPRLAPTITTISGDRTSVLLGWRDPSKGKAQFIVVQVLGSRGEPVRNAGPGTTQVAVEGLDPATAPYCFLIIAVLGTERGVSAKRCTSSV